MRSALAGVRGVIGLAVFLVRAGTIWAARARGWRALFGMVAFGAWD
jgi:hypothetical protein